MNTQNMRIFLQGEVGEAVGDTHPVVMVKSGVSPFPVGFTSGGRTEAVHVFWSPSRVTELKNILEERKTLKSYMGHSLDNERDLNEWIGTLQAPYEIVADDEGVSLIGQYKVHGDNEGSKLLESRISGAPSEIKFSLDFFSNVKPVKRDGVMALEVTEIVTVRSLDWVPEAGFDNGLFDGEETAQTVTQSYNRLLSITQEVEKMTRKEFKDLHPEEYEKIVQGVQGNISQESNEKISKLEEDLKEAIEKAKVNQASSKQVPFTDSEEYKVLHQAKSELEDQVKSLTSMTKEQGKKIVIIEEQRMEKLANDIAQSVLNDSSVPKNLHSKVRSMVDHRDFVKEGEEFEPGSECSNLFTQAFKGEVEDWEGKLSKSVGVGLETSKDDGGALTQSTKDDRDLAFQMARSVGKIRSDQEK